MEVKRAFKSADGKNAVLKLYDSLLEQWVTPSETINVSTSYGNTFIIASGPADAPPLILLHGSAMNSIMWTSDVKEYAGSFRVYAVDIPGEPGKSDEKQLPFEGAAFEEWLNEVYHALGLKKASLVGISLGAWLAVKFSVSYPEKVDKLVLLCPGGIGPQKASFAFKALAYMIFGDRGMKSLYKKVNGNQYIPDKILAFQMLIGKNFNYRKETIPLFSDSELVKLNMPVLLFVGEKDVMFHSEKTASRLKGLLPHAVVNVIPGVGHTLLNLTDKISEFLAFKAKN